VTGARKGEPNCKNAGVLGAGPIHCPVAGKKRKNKEPDFPQLDTKKKAVRKRFEARADTLYIKKILSKRYVSEE